jgi:RNA polymerase sigma factor (sigma-70 family)
MALSTRMKGKRRDRRSEDDQLGLVRPDVPIAGASGGVPDMTQVRATIYEVCLDRTKESFAADDLTQDIAMLVVEQRAIDPAYLPTLDAVRAFAVGAMQMRLKRAARDQRTREPLERSFAEETKVFRSPLDQPDRSVSRQLVRGYLLRALASLSEVNRAVLILRFFEGLTPSAIAVRLNMKNANTASVQICRAMDAWRAKLNPEEKP